MSGARAVAPRVRSLLILIGALAAVAGCSRTDGSDAGGSSPGPEGSERSPASVAFAELASVRDSIRLEEPRDAALTEITDLDVDADGRLLVPAPTAGEVRLHAPDGSLVERLGGRGEGPGEFRRPMFAAFGPDGGILVTDADQPRVTRFDADLSLDTVFRLGGAFFGSQIASTHEDVAVFALKGTDSAKAFGVYSSEGDLEGRFGRLPSGLRDTPGWMAAARSRLASDGTRFFGGINLFYPLLLYDPESGSVDSLGTPPPSWRPASRPDPGTFEGREGREHLEEWRRTFTTVSGLEVYRDSLLLVEHESLDPETLEHREASYRIDVYRLRSTPEKLVADVDLPGRLLHAGRSVHLLTATPADAPGWTVTRYDLEVGGLR